MHRANEPKVLGIVIDDQQLQGPRLTHRAPPTRRGLDGKLTASGRAGRAGAQKISTRERIDFRRNPEFGLTVQSMLTGAEPASLPKLKSAAQLLWRCPFISLELGALLTLKCFDPAPSALWFLSRTVHVSLYNPEKSYRRSQTRIKLDLLPELSGNDFRQHFLQLSR